jgi:Domain of unknown function (DUF4375)
MKKYLPNASENYWLINEVFEGIEEEMKNAGRSQGPQRVVYLVWHSAGIIGNGGLFYFFEHDFDVEEVAAAYDAIGLPESASILRQAIAKFPNSKRPVNFQKCMEFLDQHEDFFESLSTNFWHSQKGLEDILASYIKKHSKALSKYSKQSLPDT